MAVSSRHKYKQMLQSQPDLCKSQVYNEVYNKLIKDKRIDRFVALVQYCSTCGYDMKKTVEFISSSLPYYIDKKQFDVKCFEDMIKNHSEIAIAWGYGTMGDEISNIIVKNKALQLVKKTDKMEDIQIYNSMYGNNDNNVQDNSTVINFNIKKK